MFVAGMIGYESERFEVWVGEPGKGAARIEVLDKNSGRVLANWFGFEPTFYGGVNVVIDEANMDLYGGAGNGGAPVQFRVDLERVDANGVPFEHSRVFMGDFNRRDGWDAYVPTHPRDPMIVPVVNIDVSEELYQAVLSNGTLVPRTVQERLVEYGTIVYAHASNYANITGTMPVNYDNGVTDRTTSTLRSWSIGTEVFVSPGDGAIPHEFGHQLFEGVGGVVGYTSETFAVAFDRWCIYKDDAIFNGVMVDLGF